MSLGLPSRIFVTSLVCIVGAESAPVRMNLAAQVRNRDQNAPVQPVVQTSTLSVAGYVLKSDRKTRVSDVKVRMRDITTGAVVGTTVSDRTGAFSFQAPGPGLYIIEAVRDDGKVRAITDQFAITNTIVRVNITLPGEIALGAILTSSLIAVLAAGTATGIIPVIPPGRGRGASPAVTSPER